MPTKSANKLWSWVWNGNCWNVLHIQKTYWSEVMSDKVMQMRICHSQTQCKLQMLREYFFLKSTDYGNRPGNLKTIEANFDVVIILKWLEHNFITVKR